MKVSHDKEGSRYSDRYHYIGSFVVLYRVICKCYRFKVE